MYGLTVFEQNGQLLTDSREVALMVDKEHSKLLRDIRGYCEYLTEANFGLSEYFIGSSYQDSTGRTLPRYLCTKMGCDMIANKMVGKKGVQYSKQISFKEQVECISVVADILRVNDASKLLMIGQLYKSYDLPTEFLPKYEYNGSRELKSATDLLKQFDLGMSAKNFNVLMREQGYLEERSRKSTSSPNGTKKYNALTENGLKYGENAVSPQCQREVQPMYYADSFKELFDIVVGLVVV